MLNPCAALFLAVALLCGGASAALSQGSPVQPGAEVRRIAMVIGNQTYRAVPPLQNAAADARAMADLLRSRGFEVLDGYDLDRSAMNQLLNRFEQRLSAGMVALVYYAGHGVQIAGANHLVPVDMQAESERDVLNDGISLSQIMERMAGVNLRSGGGLNLLIIDACRDNPFTPLGRALGAARGLSTAGTSGTMVLYAAGSNQQAIDRLGRADRNPNGLFTRTLLRVMQVPGLPVREMIARVRVEVADAARSIGREQTPALYDEAVGDFVFTPGIAGAAAAVPTVSLELLDLAFWQSIQGSRNAGDYDAYLAQFPAGRFAALAQARLRELRSAVVQQGVEPVVAPVPSPALPRGLADGEPSRPGQVFQDCAECPDMTVVPGGRFAMGSRAEEAGRSPNEGPQREVQLPGAFGLGRHHVSVAEYRAFTQATGRADPASCWEWSRTGGQAQEAAGLGWANPGFPQTDRDPVVCVSWEDAQDYVRWLSRRTGHRYRLPSEAEWEYAARAGQSSAYWWGEDASQCRFANAADQATREALPENPSWSFGRCRDGFAYTSPGGIFPANRFGLHDMAGNAYQWTADCYQEDYARASVAGPAAMAESACELRVIRGGSWRNYQSADLRAAHRLALAKSLKFNTVGFRVARTLGG